MQFDSELASRERMCGQGIKTSRTPGSVSDCPLAECLKASSRKDDEVLSTNTPSVSSNDVLQAPPVRRASSAGIITSTSWTSPETWSQRAKDLGKLSRSSAESARSMFYVTSAPAPGPRNRDLQKVSFGSFDGIHSDATERCPVSPDPALNDITPAELAEVISTAAVIENKGGIWRGIPSTTVDDVYPVKYTPPDEFDLSSAQYQGPMEYLILLVGLKQLAIVSGIITLIRVVLVSINLLVQFVQHVRAVGARTFWNTWGLTNILKGGALVAVFMTVYAAVSFVITFVANVLFHFTISLLCGEYNDFKGIAYGVKAWSAYYWAVVQYYPTQFVLYRWGTMLPPPYKPVALYKKGVICMIKLDGSTRFVFIERKDRLRGWLIPDAHYKTTDTPFSSVIFVEHGPMTYVCYWKKHIQVQCLERERCVEWNIFDFKVGSPSPIGPEFVFGPGVVDTVLLEDGEAPPRDFNIEEIPAYQGPEDDTPFSDLISSLNAIPGYDGPTAAVVTDAVALIAVVMETRSKTVLVTQALALLVRYPQLGDVVACEIRRSIDRIHHASDSSFDEALLPQYQGITTGFRESYLGSEFMSLIGMFTTGGVAATVGLVDLSFVKSLQSFANHVTAFESLESVLRKFAKFVMAMVSVFVECVKTRSLAPLLKGVTMHPSRYVKLANELMNEVRIRDSNNQDSYLKAVKSFDVDLRNGQLNEEERMEMMEELYGLGDKFEALKRGENDQLIYQTLVNTRAALRREIDALRMKTELGKFKEEPFAVGLIGPPGVGKSTLVRSYQRIVASYMKVTDSAAIGYQWKLAQKYADGLTGSKRVYIFDDVDQKTGVPAYGDASPYVDWILVRNSKPTLANMAEAPDKGKYAYNAKMSIWVSNKMPTWQDVSIHVADPHAFARRFNDVWVCELAPGVSLKRVESGKAGDDAWIFTEYRWNTAARNNSDALFLKTGVVLRSRLALLKRTTKDFLEKMALEEEKMKKANAPDEPACAICGVSMSDHRASECVVVDDDPPISLTAATFQGPTDTVTETTETPPRVVVSIPAPNVAPRPVSPMEEAGTDAVSPLSKMDVVEATKIATWFVAGLYVLHVVTMIWGMWFLTLILEVGVLSFAVYFVNLEEEGKVKVALLLFPKTALMYLIAKGIVTFQMPALEKVVGDLRTATALDKLKVAVPVLLAVGMVIWCWSGGSTKYQSVTTPEDPDIVRTQPKKEQWAILGSTPRNVSTASAKTYNQTGFKKAVESCHAVATVGTRSFGLHYVNSKTWVTNAHHFLPGPPPRYSELCVDLVFPEKINVKITLGSFSGDFVIDSKAQMKQIKGRDVVLVRIDEMVVPGSGLINFLPGDIDVNAEYTSGILYDVKEITKPVWKETKGMIKYRKAKVADRLVVIYDLHDGNDFGMCGSLLGAPSAGGGYLVLAMHSAGLTGMSIGEPLTRAMITSEGASLYEPDGVRKVTDIMTYQSTLLREPGQMGPGSDLAVVSTFGRTHVGSAVRKGAKILPVGSIDGFHARSFKSDLMDSPFRALIEAKALDLGLGASYVNPTRMLSRKEGDDITSPFTLVLSMRENKRGDQSALDWAVEDYLQPLEQMLMETKPYRKFTFVEALSGTDELTPTNMATSTGPPYNSQKKNFFMKLEDDVWTAEPNILADQELVDATVRRGEIPCVAVNLCLKAEAISATKADECRMRVLEVGPTCHSTAIKRLMGFLVPVIKSNKALFEMSIGMNVYGLDAERLYERMLKGECFDGDLRMQDGRTSTQYMDAITKVLLRLCKASGMPPDDQEELRLLLLSFGDRMMCILGDVLIVSGGNPTGWYGTAIVASLVTILLMRTSFYLAHVGRFSTPPDNSFRSAVELEVQGDDNVNCVPQKHTRSWFNGDSVTKFAGCYGHEYTSAEKGEAKVEWKRADKLSYLKRSFRKVDGQIVMALELKSIAKQLMFYRKPKGGSVESQLAVNLTNASRELSLHGKETYDDWKPLLEKCAVVGNATESRYFDVRSWRETFDGVLSGTLSELLVTEVDLGEASYQSAEGSNLVIATATESASVVPVPPAAVIAAPAMSDPGSVQHRAVRVKTHTLSNLDVDGSLIASFDVTNELLNNTQLVDVFDRFHNMNFDSITLRIQHTCSGTMYGMYAVVAIQEAAFYASGPLNYPTKRNLHHTNYHYVFNPGNGEDIEFTLPWFGKEDRMSCVTSDDNQHPTWRIMLFCLSKLTDAIGTNGAAVATMSFLANFNNVRFGVPVFQGKKPGVKISGVMQAVGAVGAALMTVIPGAQPFIPIALGLAAGGKALAEAGHTRTRDPVIAMPSIRMAVTGLGPCDGKDNGMVADWIQAAQISTDSQYGAVGPSEDEMTFSSLARRTHLVHSGAITTSMASGYVLECMQVSPYVSTPNEGTGHCYHPFAHSTMMFDLWNGSMHYDVTFACNMLQSAMLYVYWRPTYIAAGSTTAGEFVSGATGCIIEVDPKKKYRISVPWLVNRAMCFVEPGVTNIAAFNGSANGFLTFVVLNPLSAPYTSSIKMFIEMSVGQDFTVGGTKSFANHWTSSTQPTEDILKVQGTLVEGGFETDECWIVGPSATPNVNGVVVSSGVTSIKTLCQRYCPYPVANTATALTNQINFTGSSANTNYYDRISIPFYPEPPSLAGGFWLGVNSYPQTVTRSAGVAATYAYGDSVSFTTIGWLRPMFLGAKGSMSHKVLVFPNTVNSSINSVRMLRLSGRLGHRLNYVEERTSTALFGGTKGATALPGAAFFPLQGPGVQAADFVVPYNSHSRFYPLSSVSNKANDEDMSLVIETESFGDFSLQMYSAAGADFSFVGFRFSPMVS